MDPDKVPVATKAELQITNLQCLWEKGKSFLQRDSAEGSPEIIKHPNNEYPRHLFFLGSFSTTQVESYLVPVSKN